MPLPMLKSCCYYVPLKTGCYILSAVSTLASIANLVAGAWHFPRHYQREPEDNLISMSNVIFSSLCTISNIVTFVSIRRKKLSHLQMSIVFNSIFIVCIFLVAVVTCVFRLNVVLERPENVVIIVFALLVGAIYSLYYVTMINSLYRKMKMVYGENETLVITSVPRHLDVPRPSYDRNSSV